MPVDIAEAMRLIEGAVCDPLVRLYSVTSGSTTTTFVYDGDRIAAEYDASGTLVQCYVYGGNGNDPILWYEGAGFGASNRQYLLANQQGFIDVTDSNGNALAVNQYHPYGLGSSLNEGRFQFTGQAYIPEVGLYYYKARMYNPNLGRFMQTDPIGYTSDLDLYAYVGNDPIDGTDPSGLCDQVKGNCPQPQDKPQQTQGNGEDGQKQPVPPPKNPDGTLAKPPIPPPPGKSGKPNEWQPVPGTKGRPVKWKPREPVPSAKGGQPGSSWDPAGHWDQDNGAGVRTRYRPDGTPVDHNNNPIPKPVKTIGFWGTIGGGIAYIGRALSQAAAECGEYCVPP